MLRKLFGTKAEAGVGERLYAVAVAQARRPVFYTDMGVPDRIDARFELYTLHVLLLILRLRDEDEAGIEPAQALFDAYVSALDHALRELGVGDVSMGRKMRSLGQAMYGRMTAYEAPLRAGDSESLSQAIARNVHEAETATAGSDRLATYAIAMRGALAEQSMEALMTTGPVWSNPEVVA